jgi:hypothetical protein
MQKFSEYLLGNTQNGDALDVLDESKITFKMKLKWDNEDAIVGFEQQADSDNYKVTINTPVGFASYFVNVENDGEITGVKGPVALASMLNNFILLEKKRLKK